MCSIFGAISIAPTVSGDVSHYMTTMLTNSLNRGRDGIGVCVQAGNGFYESRKVGTSDVATFIQEVLGATVNCGPMIFLGNARAEPTTEWVKDKKVSDQQPYQLQHWTIVHNGTIANDKELRATCEDKLETGIDSAAIVELLASKGEASNQNAAFEQFYNVVTQLKGSYAILAKHDKFPGIAFTACNYRPIWTLTNASGKFFASETAMLPLHTGVPVMQDPYTVAMHGDKREPLRVRSLGAPDKIAKTLVVCSGGMDSTVAASKLKASGFDITLINFQYGCRAESNELKAVRAIAERMQVPLVEFPIPIYNPTDSPLFDKDAQIAGGEAGAEFAHEWVPARNLVMLSVATAYAEANGFRYIALGNNLEEAGAYPDNEPEFVNKFNEVLPFAVADGKKINVLMPVGNLMKHEIVRDGISVDAPLDLTWSCYRNGEHHCGTCGPCMMRKTAFQINGFKDTIPYEDDIDAVTIAMAAEAHEQVLAGQVTPYVRTTEKE